MIYLTNRDPLKSGPIREGKFDYYWNHKRQELVGPIHDMERFLEREAEVIDFDLEYQRKYGFNKAQVFRNHRKLRLLGLIKDGVYVARANKGSPVAA